MRNGKLASALFSLLCGAGIVTLFSQAETKAPVAPGTAASASVSLDPGASPSTDFGSLIPSSLEKGVLLQTSAQEGSRPERPARLRLR